MASSNELLAFIIESSPIGIAFLDQGGNFIHVNRNMINRFGYTREEFSQISYQEITTSLFLSLNILKFKELVNRQIDSYQLRKKMIKKDGVSIDIHVSVSSPFFRRRTSLLIISVFTGKVRLFTNGICPE